MSTEMAERASGSGDPVGAAGVEPLAACALPVEDEVRPVPRSIVEGLARAVAVPEGGALLLTPDNTARTSANGLAEWVPVHKAIESGNTFTVELAPDVLGIDDDDPSRADDVIRFAEKLRAEGLQPVVIASGRPGHHHLFCRVEGSREEYEIRAKEAGLHPRRSIRPPLSPHRLGLPVRLLRPDEPEAALRALTPPQPDRPLSAEMMKILRDGDVERRYPSRSEMVMGLACAAVNARWSFEHFYAAMLRPENKGGAKVQERKRRSARRYLEGSWIRAKQYVRDHPPVTRREDTFAHLVNIEKAVNAEQWADRRGTDWAVMRAHLKLAWGLGAVEYDASVREIAEHAGVERQTAGRAHARLRAAGWLRLVREHQGSHAQRWKLCLPGRAVTSSDVPAPHKPPLTGAARLCGAVVTYPAGDPGLDLWRNHMLRASGLGKLTCRVWNMLDTALTAAELAKRLGRSKRSAQRHMKRLSTYGLVRQDELGRWRAVHRCVEDLASLLGVSGALKAQQERHREEREEYLCDLQDRRMEPACERRPPAASQRSGTGRKVGVKMPFGRYRDQDLADLPDGYLKWLLGRDLRSGKLRSAVEAEGRTRRSPSESAELTGVDSTVSPPVVYPPSGSRFNGRG